MTDGWGDVIHWPGVMSWVRPVSWGPAPDAPETAPRPISRPADVGPVYGLLRAWAAWDRACDRRCKGSCGDPCSEHDPNAQWTSPGARVTVDMEEAVDRFAVEVCGGVPVRERLAAARRGAQGLGVGWLLANRWALAAAAGHT